MNVVTLNLWNTNPDAASGLAARMEAIITSLRALAPDVVGLQEVTQTRTIPSQAQTIGNALGLHVAEHPQPVANSKDGRTICNAVLSRRPILRSQWFPLPVPDSPRGVTHAVLSHPLGELHVFSTHLNYKLDDGARREKQVAALHDFVAAQKSDLPKLILGDFNAEPDSNEIRFLRGLATLESRSAHWWDAWLRAHPKALPCDGVTWSDANPFAAPCREGERRIDYIWVSEISPKTGCGEVRFCRVCCNHAAPNGVFPTDHFGVFADVNFEGSEA